MLWVPRKGPKTKKSRKGSGDQTKRSQGGTKGNRDKTQRVKRSQLVSYSLNSNPFGLGIFGPVEINIILQVLSLLVLASLPWLRQVKSKFRSFLTPLLSCTSCWTSLFEAFKPAAMMAKPAREMTRILNFRGLQLLKRDTISYTCSL